MTTDTLRISEMFRSLQGESTFAGLPCTFVRLSGCAVGCRWCDTGYAHSGGTTMSIDDVLEKVRKLGLDLVEVTGGEPLAQPAAIPLLQQLATEADTVLLETSGTVSIADVPPEVRIIMDVKCPGSGADTLNHWENMALLKPVDEVKFVISSAADFIWALRVIEDHRLVQRVSTVLVSPVTGEVQPEDLAAWVLESGLPLRMQMQLHKIIWPADPRGK